MVYLVSKTNHYKKLNVCKLQKSLLNVTFNKCLKNWAESFLKHQGIVLDKNICVGIVWDFEINKWTRIRSQSPYLEEIQVPHELQLSSVHVHPVRGTLYFLIKQTNHSFELSEFTMGTILGKGFAQTQVHSVFSTSAEGTSAIDCMYECLSKTLSQDCPMVTLHSLLVAI